MKFKRALCLFMTTILLSSSMPFNAFAEDISVDESAIVVEDTTASGSALSVISPEIDVDFNITGQRDGGFNGEITIKNVSDKLIENWQIEMQFPQEITNIWNANILSHEDDMYIIKNAGYNNNINIPVGESVSFGFGGTYDNEIIEPSNIELLLSPDTAKKKDYDIEYQVMSDWGSGYTAQIIITNNTNAAMEGWHLNFDYARKIDSIWNAAVELIGEALGGMTGKVRKNGTQYTMFYKYYLIDTYEFALHYDKNAAAVDNEAHYLHEAGLAKEYKIIGCYSGAVTWDKGEIFMKDDYKEMIINSDDSMIEYINV